MSCGKTKFATADDRAAKLIEKSFGLSTDHLLFLERADCRRKAESITNPSEALMILAHIDDKSHVCQ